MKNIKKSFALLLAFCLIFGICTIGAGAVAPVAFTDTSSINTAYAKAVDVLSGMGILVGSDDNNDGKLEFNPTGTLTRAQAAKLVAYVILGSDAADKLPSKTQFSDVKSTDWSAKYIYYLSNKGIINGYGDGTFGPSDTVTATQLSKLLLSAVGYGKVNEFTGEGWDVNVFNLAVDLGIYDDALTADYDAAATRQEAALYVYNTMTKINLVTYSTDNAEYTERTINGSAADYASYKYDYTDIKGTIVANAATGTTYTQFKSGSTVYNLNIDTDTSIIGHEVEVFFNNTQETNDAYTSSTDKYYYDAYYIDDLSTVVPIGFSTNKQVYTALGGTNFSASTSYSSSFAVWINYGVADSTTYPASNYELNWASYSSSSPNTYAYLQPGGAMKVYNGSYVLDENGSIIAFVDTTYTVEKVTDVTTTSGSESISLSSSNGGNAISNTKTNDLVKEYDGIAKGDYVSVTLIGGIYNLTKCKEVDDVYISTKSNDIFYTINSTYYYSYSSKLSYSAPVIGGTYDLYLDKTGSYAYAVQVDAANTKLAYVTYLYASSSTINYGDNQYDLYAQSVDSTGTEQNYLITPAQYAILTGAKSTDATAKSYTGTDISYTYDSSTNTYTLKTVKSGVTPTVNPLAKISTKTDTTYYSSASSSTVGVFDTSSTYNLPKYDFLSSTTLTTGVYYGSSVTYIYVSGTGSSLKITSSTTKPTSGYDYSEVYYYPVALNDGTNNSTVSVVFVGEAPNNSTITSLIYSYGYDTNGNYSCYPGYTDANGDSYLYAFLDGVYTKTNPLKVSSSTDNVTGGYLNLGFYKYTVDSDGYYTLTPYNTGDLSNAVVTNKLLTNIYNNKITAGGLVDVDATDAKIVNLDVNHSVKTLSDIYDLITSGYTVNISFWSYNYTSYLNTYGAGSSYITTDAIYINSITK